MLFKRIKRQKKLPGEQTGVNAIPARGSSGNIGKVSKGLLTEFFDPHPELKKIGPRAFDRFMLRRIAKDHSRILAICKLSPDEAEPMVNELLHVLTHYGMPASSGYRVGKIGHCLVLRLQRQFPLQQKAENASVEEKHVVQ